jgi:hypothetical protein
MVFMKTLRDEPEAGMALSLTTWRNDTRSVMTGQMFAEHKGQVDLA